MLGLDLQRAVLILPKVSNDEKNTGIPLKKMETAVKSGLKSDKYVQKKPHLYETAANLKVTDCLIYF